MEKMKKIKRVKRSIALIIIFTVAFTFTFGSISSAFEDSNVYAASKLSKPKISLRTASNKITVSWEKVKNAKKYQIAYRLSSSKKWTYKTTTKLKFTIKGKYNKKYKIKVRALKGNVKSSWSRTATRKTEKQKVPTAKTYDLSKPSKLKNYSSFKIGKTYRLKDPMGTGRTKKVKIEYGDIINISGEGVTVSVTGTTSKGYNYEAQVTSAVVSYTYGVDPTGTLMQSDPQKTLNNNSNSSSASDTLSNVSKNAGITDIGNTQLPDLSGITIPGVDLSNIDWSQIQLPDLTVPDTQLPDTQLPDVSLPNVQLPGAQLPNISIPDVQLPDTSSNTTVPTLPDSGTSTITGVTDGTTSPALPGVTDGTAIPTVPGITDGSASTTIPGITDISSVLLPNTMTVVWTLDNTQPKRTQKDYVDKNGDKVRGTVTSLQEILALRQLQTNAAKPVWVKIYQEKTLVYESYNRRN